MLAQQLCDIEEIEVQLLLEAINKRYGYDFTQYTQASIKRRIESYIVQMNYTHITDCVSTLLYDEAAFELFVNSLTVHVTEMFRDPDFFRALHNDVFNLLQTYPYINVWIAGCASGEEAYSIAILLHEADLLSRCKIYATDICKVIIDQAKQGIFEKSLLREYTKNYQTAGGNSSFSDYYVCQGKWAIMPKFIRDAIHFMPHNLARDESFIQAHLVICRNVLIYFNQSLQDRVLSILTESTIPRGFLCLGDKEMLHQKKISKCFDEFAEQNRIYRRNDSLLCDI